MRIQDILIKSFAVMIFSILLFGCSSNDGSTEVNEMPEFGEGTNGVSILDFGAIANDNLDDTQSIQATINEVSKQGGGTVLIPNGEFLVNVKTSINLKSNITLLLDEEAYLTAIATSEGSYRVLKIVNVENVKVIGGNIKGDRNTHIGDVGEWGMGIAIYNGKNISIENIEVRDCWGDGFYIAKSTSGTSENITLNNVKSINNRRAGMSITSVKGMTITDSEFSNTNGARPEVGLGIEPNANEEVANVTIKNCKFNNNTYFGLQIGAGHKDVNVTNISVINNHFEKNNYYAVKLSTGTVSSDIIQMSNVDVFNNSFKDNIFNYQGEVKSGDKVLMRANCQDCTISPNTVLTD